jgi:hypothetical protein
MGYMIKNTTLRIVNRHDGKVYKPFIADLYVDSCRLANRRYTVYTDNHTTGREYAWAEIITDEDNARCRFGKWAYIQKLLALEQAHQDTYNALVKFTQNKTVIDF